MKLKFDKMTKAQKRVAIAKDVIEQLKMETYKVYGGYLSVRGADGISQSSLAKSPECRVCAIGAATVSAIRLGNKFESRLECPGPVFCFNVVRQWFSQSQADLIEESYEGFEGSEKGQAFHDKHPESVKRMTAIFQNIIENNGTFKP